MVQNWIYFVWFEVIIHLTFRYRIGGRQHEKRVVAYTIHVIQAHRLSLIDLVHINLSMDVLQRSKLNTVIIIIIEFVKIFYWR